MPITIINVHDLAGLFHKHRFFWLLWLSDRSPQGVSVPDAPFELISSEWLKKTREGRLIFDQCYQIIALLRDPNVPVEVHLRPVFLWDEVFARNLRKALEDDSLTTLTKILSDRLPEQIADALCGLKEMDASICVWESYPHLLDIQTEMMFSVVSMLSAMQRIIESPDFLNRMQVEQDRFTMLFNQTTRHVDELKRSVSSQLSQYQLYASPNDWPKCLKGKNDTVSQCKVVRSMMFLWGEVFKESINIQSDICAFTSVYPYSLWQRLLLVIESLVLAVRRLWAHQNTELLPCERQMLAPSL